MLNTDLKKRQREFFGEDRIQETSYILTVMSKILLSQPFIDQTKSKLQERVEKLKQKGIVPSLKVILVGKNPASVIYTKKKKEFCHSIGADCQILSFEEDMQEKKLREVISGLNQDAQVHGLFVQLPLPKSLQTVDVANLIHPQKDVDGFHRENLGKLFQNEDPQNYFIPCTPKGIISLLDFYQVPIAGKHYVIIGRSLIVGKPLGQLLLNRNATVTTCHSHTQDLKALTRQADAVVCAVGRPSFFDEDFFTAGQTLIDVGINRNSEGKLVGDLNYPRVKDLAGAITPVPGGVGPLTVLSLIQNLLQAAEKSLSQADETSSSD